MKLRDAVEWLILGAIWGASFLFMRVAVAEFGALALVEVRLAVAAAVLAVPVAVRGDWAPLRARWRTLLLLGAVNSAIPFTLFAWAMRSISAGDGSVLNATAALFAAAIGRLVFREELSVRRAVGLLVGFAGVVVLVWEKVSFAGNRWALLAGLSAALLYGVSSHLVNRRLKGVPPLAVSAGSLLFASLLLLPLAVVNLPPTPPSALGWLAAVALGVGCTAVAYLMYFRLMRNTGPTRAVTVTYLIPAFGILWGNLFLHELITLSTVAGGVVIVLGTVLVQLPDRVRNPATATPGESHAPVTR